MSPRPGIVQADVDFSGPQRAGQQVHIYQHNTRQHVTIYSHDGKTAIPNPTTVGNNGRVVFTAPPGTYDVVGLDLHRTVELPADHGKP